ncbi:hypothetical protein E0Z10_g9515 [Xylaria hypoxylon]|uniref:Uncharacterized protein n=1 Tax=Xylaria hypoxylon TaxID=37992 RepID=A0A4Z0YRV7_9PEZI|nr:hypothetical protein E0Z10_g9515 [Xylaria hypoxylon]
MTATFTAPLAALTTVFTPPCPITWLLTTTKVPSQYPSFATTAPASCDPPSWDQYVPQRGFEYYSPAICPSGFYVGPSCIITNPRTAQGFPAIQGGETAAYCIPNGHTCTSDTSDFRGGVWGVSRTASVNGAQVTVGPAIQIRWRDEDIDNLETDPITPGARTAQPRSPQQTLGDTEISSTPDPTTTSTQPPSSSTSSSTESSTTSSKLTLRPGPGRILPTSTTESTSTSTSTPSSFSSSSSSVTLPASSTPAQESQSSTSAATTESPSKQPVNDIEKGRGGGNSSSSNFIVAAIVLTAVLITIIATYGAYTILQRYRRYRAGETTEFFVFQVEAWVRRQLRLKQRVGGTTMEEKEGDGRDRRKIPDAELGTEGPLPELGSAQPFGTKENPAELPTMERWSWRSRMSRILTVRTRRGSLASRP